MIHINELLTDLKQNNLCLIIHYLINILFDYIKNYYIIIYQCKI